MDTFAEQVQKKNTTSKDIFIKVITVVAVAALFGICLILAPIINFYLAVVGMFILMGGIYVIWYVFSSLEVEYEYSIVSGSITISKIIAKRKRKEIISFETSLIENIREYNSRDFDMDAYNKVFELCGNSEKDKAYMMAINSKNHGKSLVIFNPNEKFINAMRPYLSSQITATLLP